MKYGTQRYYADNYCLSDLIMKQIVELANKEAL